MEWLPGGLSMFMRCCVVLAIVAGSGTAWANLTSDPDPVDVGNVVVGSNGTATANAVSDQNPPGGDTLDHFALTGADCTQFTVTASQTLPFKIDNTAPMPFTVGFTPTSRGNKTCTVSFKNNGNGNVGTPFTVIGKGVAPVISAPRSEERRVGKEGRSGWSAGD